ncbi:MAG: DNA polymerase III subunit alpha [Brevefilum sp.]|nr:DNA polymerase III subunit alpha [Brevefilum sp.]
MQPPDIAYLRTHSYFGFLESLLSPANLVEAAVKQGVQVLGLTDHQYLTGAIEFYEACLQAGIKPILGLEIDLVYNGYQGRLTLLAKDINGWSNLCKLSSLTLVEGEQINLTTLHQYQQGLIALVGGYRDLLRNLLLNAPAFEQWPGRYLQDLKAIYPEDCFVEVQRYANGPLQNEPALLELAKHHGLPLVASQNIHYLKPQDQRLFRTINAIRDNTVIGRSNQSQHTPVPSHFPDIEDFIHRFHDLPEALINIQQITERCNLALPIGRTHFPTFPTPNGVTQSEFLRSRAYAGAKAIYKTLTPQVINRLDHELSVISEMGYEPIFLIMEDVLNHARQLGIPTSSRGSAASSLVAHCLNITSPDPLALNLYFERFLNPARKKPPDIDTDIASHRREEVIQYVFDTYHPDRVAMVGTINRYRPKSALGDVAKAYGLSPETIRQLSKKLPSSFRFQSDDERTDPFAPLLREASIPIIKDIITDAKAILDTPRHLSVHPGGIVIAPFAITDLIPLMHSSTLGINHAQFDLTGIEKLGMVKIDLLGIRGLTVLGKVADQIQTWHQSEYSNGLQVLEHIPLTDPETAQTVSNAQTIGCFQIESPGMRATLREIKANSLEGIMAALALYRPGPLRGGLRDAFVRRFRGEEPVTHIHESLTDLLNDTLGVILYQEQVLRIAHELGGLSIAQADILRRAMSHFDPGGIMLTLRSHFIAGAQARHNVPPETAERIWEMMAAFAGYGFPKAHAASYAQLAWNSAWCKTHYPAEFMCAVLGYGGGYYSQRVYLMEARRLGLTVKPPHINHANERFRVGYPEGQPILYVGLNQVRDLTNKTIQAILKHRPFHSIEDFLIRVDPQQKEARHLIMCGGLEGLGLIPEALKRIEHKRVPGQMNLFTSTAAMEDWDDAQKSKAQHEILGISLALSPLEQHAHHIQSAGVVSTVEAQNLIGEKVCVAGMRQVFRRFRNRSNQMMGNLTLEDFEGSLLVLIPPALYRRQYSELRQEGPFLIDGVMEGDQDKGQTRLVAERIILLD